MINLINNFYKSYESRICWAPVKNILIPVPSQNSHSVHPQHFNAQAYLYTLNLNLNLGLVFVNQYSVNKYSNTCIF